MRERVTVRMTDEMIARLDGWIASQPGYVSRQEAVRRCVDFALEKPSTLREDGAHGIQGPSSELQRSTEQIRAILTESAARFSLGRQDDVRGVAAALKTVLPTLASTALPPSAGNAQSLVAAVVAGLEQLLDTSSGEYRRADLRLALLSADLLLAVGTYPYAATQAGSEYCPSCGSAHLFPTDRLARCVDCGWREALTADNTEGAVR